MDKWVEHGSIGKSSFCNKYIKTSFGQELPWMLNINRGNFNEKQNIYIISSSFPLDCLLVVRGKWSKLKSPVGSTQTLCTSKHNALKLHITHTAFPREMHNLNLIMRKHQIKPDWGLFNEITGPYSWKCQGHEIVRNFPILNKTEGTG